MKASGKLSKRSAHDKAATIANRSANLLRPVLLRLYLLYSAEADDWTSDAMEEVCGFSKDIQCDKAQDSDLILQEYESPTSPNAFLSQSRTKKKKIYFYLMLLSAIYCLAVAVTIPAIPALSLQICHGNAAQAAYLYGIANFIRFALEFAVSPVTGCIADSWGRKPLFVLGFMICGAEFMLLSWAPSVPTLMATRAIAGE